MPNPPEETRFTKENASEMGARGGAAGKGSCKKWRSIIEKEMEEIDVCRLSKKKMRNAEIVIKALFKEAKNGNVRATEKLVEWIDGGAAQALDLTSGGGPVSFIATPVKTNGSDNKEV